MTDAQLLQLRNDGHGDAADEISQLRAAISCCLSFVQINDRARPFTDIDIVGEMVSVRLTGLCALAEAIQPGCRQVVTETWLATAQRTPAPEAFRADSDRLRDEFKALLPLLEAAAAGKPVTMAAGDWRRRVLGIINENDQGAENGVR